MRNRNLGVVLSIACCWLAPFVAHTQAASPAAVIPEAHYRFGTAIEGETVRHDFILLNKGGAGLHIEKIKTG
jgi:hypothetical protein